MSSGDPIDRAYLEINGKNVYCESIDVDLDDGTDWVEAMTKDNEPLGLAAGNRKGEIKADVAMLEDQEDDVDFLDLWKNKTNIPVTVEFEGGRSLCFRSARIAKPSIGVKHGQKTTYSLELKGWNLTFC